MTYKTDQGGICVEMKGVSSKEMLNEVECSYLGSKIRNTTSLSQPLKEFIVDINMIKDIKKDFIFMIISFKRL